MILGMNHFTVIAANPQATMDFYTDLIGLKPGFRPDLGFPGAWLYGEDPSHALLHIYFDRPVPTQRAGVIDHMAFTAKDLKAVKARFDAAGWPYDLRQRPGVPYQFFCHDPNGARVELDFDAGEAV